MKKSKMIKILASAAVISSLMLSSMSVLAAWEFGGYDTTTSDFGKIYNEIIDGSYTGKTIIEPLAEKDVEWKAEGYEYAYPHAGYDRLYLEGNAQLITRYNNMFPQWETRYKDFMWEMCGDHKIYQRQQTYIPGRGWDWDFGNEAFNIPDSAVFVPTTRYAETTDSFKAYGVGPYNMNGWFVSEAVADLYNTMGINTDNIFELTTDENGNWKNVINNTFFSDENLSRINPENGKYVVSDEEIAAKVGFITSKYVTGPVFYGSEATKNVAKAYTDMYEAGIEPTVWAWDADTVRFDAPEISWTKPTYEAEEPYKQYQYLVVNGLVFDGRNDLPYIFRYTGGKASPKVEWRYQWPEAAYPYNMVEFKYLDGRLALNADGTPVSRFPTGEFANAYVKTTDTMIQFWLEDTKGNNFMVNEVSRVENDYGYGAGYVPGAGFAANYTGEKTSNN